MKYILYGVGAYLVYTYFLKDYMKKKGIKNPLDNITGGAPEKTVVTPIIKTKDPEGNPIELGKDDDGNIVVKSGVLNGKKEDVDKFLNEISEKFKNFGFVKGSGVKFGLNGTPSGGALPMKYNHRHERIYSGPMKTNNKRYF